MTLPSFSNDIGFTSDDFIRDRLRFPLRRPKTGSLAKDATIVRRLILKSSLFCLPGAGTCLARTSSRAHNLEKKYALGGMLINEKDFTFFRRRDSEPHILCARRSCSIWFVAQSGCLEYFSGKPS